MADTQAFVEGLTESLLLLTGVTRVQFFGSILTDRFNPGSSDLDLIVEGSLTTQTKEEAIRLIRQANRLYGLRLEESVYLHPAPFFVTNWAGRLSMALFAGSLAPYVNRITGSLVTRWKKGKRGEATMTLGDYWNGNRPGIRDSRYLGELLWS